MASSSLTFCQPLDSLRDRHEPWLARSNSCPKMGKQRNKRHAAGRSDCGLYQRNHRVAPSRCVCNNCRLAASIRSLHGDDHADCRGAVRIIDGYDLRANDGNLCCGLQYGIRPARSGIDRLHTDGAVADSLGRPHPICPWLCRNRTPRGLRFQQPC